MSGVLGDIKQQVGDIGKQIGKTIAGAPKSAAKTVASQIGFEVKEGQHKPPPEMIDQAKRENADFVKELYTATPSQKPEQPKNPQASTQQQEAIEMAEENPKKSPEEIQQMMSLRQKLHQETYYQPLTTAKKRPEEAKVEGEREAERMERLKMEDLQEKKEEEEKKKPISVLQAERKTEAPLGAG